MELLDDPKPEDMLDETLDKLISLVGATASSDTDRVHARHILGAFNDLVEGERFPINADELDESTYTSYLFRELDELIELGYVDLSYQGYALTESGRERAMAIVDSNLDDVASQWRS